MLPMPNRLLPDTLVATFAPLVASLRELFGERLHTVVAYGPCVSLGLVPSPRLPVSTLALVDRVRLADLDAAAPRAPGWRKKGIAVPLLLGEAEFRASLDAFPLEYGDIIAHHVVLAGHDPFETLAADQDDLRWAIERQAKGHLIHLREGYIEAAQRPAALTDMVLASTVPFILLVQTLARLLGHEDDRLASLPAAMSEVPGVSASVVQALVDLVRQPVLANDEARRLYPDYLDTVEHLVAFVDTWKAGTADPPPPGGTAGGAR